MNPRLMNVFLTFFLVGAAAVASAQQAEAPEEPRRYKVEVIVFAYGDDVGTGSEIFLGEPIADPVHDDVLIGEEPAEDDAEPVAAPDPAAAERRFLARSELGMDNIFDELRRIDVYRPLLYTGWTELALPAERTTPVRLAALPGVPRDLDGSLTLYLGRFLHLVVDLSLAVPEAQRESPMFSDRSFDDVPRQPLRYTISEDRIFKSGDLRYFDHPKFGMLARVSRVEPDDSRQTAFSR